jgi:tetratricopeptide (TPR) repeat protein
MELLGGLSTKGTGRWEIAVDRARKTIAAYPNVVIGYGNLALSSFFLDRFGEAENALQQAAAHKKEWLELPQFLVYRYNIAFMKGDNEQMDRAIALAKGKRQAEHWVTNSQALVQARSGHVQLARRLSTRAVDLALQEGRREAAATYQSAAAVWGRPLRKPQRVESERSLYRETRPRRRLPTRDFLTLWKDADPDVAILRHAKSEYAKLP